MPSAVLPIPPRAPSAADAGYRGACLPPACHLLGARFSTAVRKADRPAVDRRRVPGRLLPLRARARGQDIPGARRHPGGREEHSPRRQARPSYGPCSSRSAGRRPGQGPAKRRSASNSPTSGPSAPLPPTRGRPPRTARAARRPRAPPGTPQTAWRPCVSGTASLLSRNLNRVAPSLPAAHCYDVAAVLAGGRGRAAVGGGRGRRAGEAPQITDLAAGAARQRLSASPCGMNLRIKGSPTG